MSVWKKPLPPPPPKAEKKQFEIWVIQGRDHVSFNGTIVSDDGFNNCPRNLAVVVPYRELRSDEDVTKLPPHIKGRLNGKLQIFLVFQAETLSHSRFLAYKDVITSSEGKAALMQGLQKIFSTVEGITNIYQQLKGEVF